MLGVTPPSSSISRRRSRASSHRPPLPHALIAELITPPPHGNVPRRPDHHIITHVKPEMKRGSFVTFAYGSEEAGEGGGIGDGLFLSTTLVQKTLRRDIT